VYSQADLAHFEGGVDVVINPQMSRLMGFTCFNVPIQIDGEYKRVSRQMLPTELSVSFGCYNSPTQEEKVRLLPDDLIGGIPGGMLV
jgi:hypothetical protein